MAGRMADSFAVAGAELGLLSQHFELAGRSVEVRFAGKRLRDLLTSPFAHLETLDPGPADLTIHVWDSAKSGAPPPPLPIVPQDAIDNPTPDHRALFIDPELNAVFHIAPRLLTAFAPTSKDAWVWIADVDELPFGEQAAPYRMIWRWWAGLYGHIMVHGAAVGTGDGGVLLVGRGGSGKSTSSIACLNAGFAFAGDDYVLLDSSARSVHSLYSTGKLEVGHANRLTGSEAMGTEERPLHGSGRTIVKGAFSMTDNPQANLVSTLPISAILAPRLRLEQTESTYTSLNRSEALRAVAVSSMIQLPNSTANDFGAMAHLVRTLPSFELGIGSDVEGIPVAIAALLREVADGR
jgi:hypothetical protein